MVLAIRRSRRERVCVACARANTPRYLVDELQRIRTERPKRLQFERPEVIEALSQCGVLLAYKLYIYSCENCVQCETSTNEIIYKINKIK